MWTYGQRLCREGFPRITFVSGRAASCRSRLSGSCWSPGAERRIMVTGDDDSRLLADGALAGCGSACQSARGGRGDGVEVCVRVLGVLGGLLIRREEHRQ